MHKTHSNTRNDRFDANRDDRMDSHLGRSSAGYSDQAEGRWMSRERSEDLAQERAQFSPEQFDLGYRDRDRGYGDRRYGDVDHHAIDRSYRASERSYGDRYFIDDYTSHYGDRGYVGPNAMSDMADSWTRRSLPRGDFDRDYRNDRWSFESRVDDDNAAIYRGGFPSQRPFIGKGPKGYKRSDERIREEICELLSDGHLDASNIEVSVKDGQVTLSGSVSGRRVKRLAEEIAESARGVADIENQLKVVKPDHEAKIRDAAHKRVQQAASGSNGDTAVPMVSTSESLPKRQVPQA